MEANNETVAPSETTATEPIPAKLARLLYLGVDDGCKFHKWVDISDVENNGQRLMLRGKHESYEIKRRKNTHCDNIAPAGTGGIYEFERTPTGVMAPGKYIGGWENKDDVVRWQAENRANLLAKKLKDDEAKANTRRYDREALEPFRLAYANANNLQKGLILADVVQYVTSGRKPKKREDDDE